MLYSLYEAQHMALAPLRFMAEWSRGWFGHPFSPLAHWPLSRRLAASSDLFLRVTERYEKPKWNLDGVGLEVAQEKPFCRLIHFKQRTPRPHKVLVVAPLSGHHATLLRDTVRALLAEHDVWVTDWINACLVPLSAGPFHLADYVDYVRAWITLLSPKLHVISVCQPTVPVLAAASLMAERGEAQPLTLVMMGGPIDARRSPTAVNNLARRKPYSWFERNAVLDLPAEYYLDTVKTVFQEFALPKGRMFVRDELVRPNAIREPALLTIEGELDDISGNGQTEAAHALCLNIPRERRAHFVAPRVGHYGIFSGRRWREVVFPHVRDFIATYSS